MRSLFVWPPFSCLVVKEKPVFCVYLILVSRKVLELKSTFCLPLCGINCSNSACGLSWGWAEQRRHTLYLVLCPGCPLDQGRNTSDYSLHDPTPPKQQRRLRAGAWMSPSPPHSHAHPAVNLSPNSISLHCDMHVSSSLDSQASRQALISLHTFMMDVLDDGWCGTFFF